MTPEDTDTTTENNNPEMDRDPIVPDTVEEVDPIAIDPTNLEMRMPPHEHGSEDKVEAETNDPTTETNDPETEKVEATETRAEILPGNTMTVPRNRNLAENLKKLSNKVPRL